MTATWKADAKCRTLPVDLSDDIFFLSPGQTTHRAKRFCFDCPVKRACLRYAIVHEEAGIWGGFTEEERKNMGWFLQGVLRQEAFQLGEVEYRPIKSLNPSRLENRPDFESDLESFLLELDLDLGGSEEPQPVDLIALETEVAELMQSPLDL